MTRHELSQEVLQSESVEPFELDGEAFLSFLRTARRGAAPGPSGMTADHLLAILESEVASELLVQVASKLAVADVPQKVIDDIRVGWLTALAKPDGRVRGIVVSDIVRRLVAKTIAKQFAKKAEVATAPFQYALSTKAGCECVAHVAHVAHALTDQDADAPIVTVDGVGTYDLISRSALLEGFLTMGDGDQILPLHVPSTSPPRAATRANFWLRALRPDQTEPFAVRHDALVWRCMRAILVEGAPGNAQVFSLLVFFFWRVQSDGRGEDACDSTLIQKN